jgi:thioredoxin-like negative regulator of GroEL
MQNTKIDEDSERSPATPHVIKSVSKFDEYIGSVDTAAPVVIQFTAPWCRRCNSLKQEIADTFDLSLHWITVDVDEITALQERFNVTQLPRLDVYCSGRTDSVESFDAKVDVLSRMLQAATSERPKLELLDDF